MSSLNSKEGLIVRKVLHGFLDQLKIWVYCPKFQNDTIPPKTYSCCEKKKPVDDITNPPSKVISIISNLMGTESVYKLSHFSKTDIHFAKKKKCHLVIKK